MSTADLSISRGMPEKADAGIPPTMHAAGVLSLSRGVIETTVEPVVTRWMILLFLAGISSLPLLQAGEDLVRTRRIQALDIAKPPARAALLLARGHFREAAHQVKWWLSQSHLSQFEQQLTEGSFAKRMVQPYLQYLLSGGFSFGNSMAIVARDGWLPNGWLYYQLSVDYMAGPGLLDRDYLRRRHQQLLEEGESDPSPDPRPAIIRFSEDCRRAGVHLVFVPIPVKCMIEPAHLCNSAVFDRPMPVLNNQDYGRLIADLRAAGVDVFDPTPAMLWPHERPRFLEQDTHWTPEWMEHVAAELADHIHSSIDLPPPAHRRRFRVQARVVARLGDIVDALGLPAYQALFSPQFVTIHRVLDAETGQAVRSSTDADVLLIGDSFSNIYSAEPMGWGDAAGFPQHLMRYMGRDIEILVRNGAAASELRAELSSRLGALRGKRLVIWQVAMHELTSSNWQVIRISPEPVLAFTN